MILWFFNAGLLPELPEDPASSDATTGGSDEQIMRLWDNRNAYGGQKLVLVPRFLEGTCQKFAIVNKQEVFLADVALALAGLGEQIGEQSSRLGVRKKVKSSVKTVKNAFAGHRRHDGQLG